VAHLEEMVPTGPTIDHSTYIGGYDIGAIAGQNRFKTPLDVWAEKLKKGPKFEGNIHTDIGNAFERPALAVYAKHKGVTLNFPGTKLHPAQAFLGATPDAVVNDRYLAQCKIVGFNTARHWGKPEDGPEGIPPEVFCQVQWESFICRANNVAPCEFAEVVAFFGTRMDVYEVPYDPDFALNLEQIAIDFWEQNVVRGIMPEVESGSAREILAALHPRNLRDELLPMDEQIREMVEEYLGLQEDEKAVKANLDTIAARLQAAIGDGAGFQSGDGLKVTWKASKGRTSWKGVAESALARLDRHIADMLVKDNTPQWGSRSLRASRKGKK